MTITYQTGNIFTSNCQTIVNTVNCVGVMGAGIALEFKLRYPDMFSKYQQFCQEKVLKTGKLWLYRNPSHIGFTQVLNFPTKHDWKQPTTLPYLEQGLDNFVKTYQQRHITSIAFPLLGAGRGGLSDSQSLKVMTQYLEQCQDIDIEIWRYDPSAEDDLYQHFKVYFSETDDTQLKQLTGLRIDYIQKVLAALKQDNINSISALSNVKGIGITTLEKLFDVYNQQILAHQQKTLF